MFGTGVVVGADVVDADVVSVGADVVEPLKKLVIVEIIDVSVNK